MRRTNDGYNFALARLYIKITAPARPVHRAIMPALRCLDMRRFASSVTVGSYMLVTEGECPAHAVVCQPRISDGTSQRM